MKENKLENLIWIIFASIGAIFVIIGLVVFGNIFNYANKVDTVGTITEISSYRNTNHNRNHEVYVSYTVEGKEYESILNSYSSSFYEGKEIKIYYDKDNPSKIGVKSLDLLFLIFPGIGLIFLIIGGTGILVKINKRKLEKRLKENGELIYANYVETVLNTSYRVNGKCPYNIICEWNNPLDNNKYIFKSKNIWINPENIIKEKNIATHGKLKSNQQLRRVQGAEKHRQGNHDRRFGGCLPPRPSEAVRERRELRRHHQPREGRP